MVASNNSPFFTAALYTNVTVKPDEALSHTISTSSYNDYDVPTYGNTEFTRSVALTNGSATPSWLTIAIDNSANSITFSGTPASSNVGALKFTVKLVDVVGAKAEATQWIIVNNPPLV